MPETVGRKPTTTNTGGALSGPDLQAASFSRQGVSDRSGIFRGEAAARGAAGISGAIEGVGQFALDVDEGIAKANLEQDLLNELDFAKETRQEDFNEQQQSRFEEASVDFRTAEQKQELLKEDLGEGGAIEAMAPEFANITERLKKAERRGAMSLDEFEIRTREALRRAIAKRPGLINELTAHAEATLNLSGAKERLKLHDKIVASQNQIDTERLDRARKQLDIAKQPYNFNDPVERLELQLNTHRQQEIAWDEGKRAREMKETFTQEEGLSLLEQNGRFMGMGAYNEFSQEISTKFFPGMSKQEFDNAKSELPGLIAKKISQFDAIGRTGGVTNTQEFKDWKETWTNAIQGLADNMQNAASGANAAEMARNQMAVIQNQWQRQVLDAGFNPEMARVANLMEPWVQASSLFQRQKHLQDKFTPMFENLLIGAVNSPSLARSLESTDGTTSDIANILDSGLKGSVPEDASKPGNKVATDFEKMVDSAVEVIDMNIGKNPSLAFKAMSDTIRKLSDPSNRNRMANATDATKNQLVELGVRQASALEPDRNRFLNMAKEQGVVIRPRTLPNGSLMFFTDGDTPKDKALLKEFNAKFTSKYNDLIKFKSTLFGMSVPQAADLLSDVYSGGSVEDIRNVIDTRRKELGAGTDTSSVDDAFLDRVIEIESSGNPNAQARTSSALGVGQFIKSTWLNTVRKHAPELMTGRTEEEVLELRRNPQISRNMIAALANDNASTLSENGLPTSPGNLYLAHFLGRNGAVNLLTATPDTPVEDVLGNAQIRANKSVLEGKTVEEVMDWAKRKFGEG